MQGPENVKMLIITFSDVGVKVCTDSFALAGLPSIYVLSKFLHSTQVDMYGSPHVAD
jgi:hypothetical protein